MSIEDDPLTDDEFEEIDEFLLSDRCPEDAMAMDTLHGFLTAIVIGPEIIPMSEWLPRVWGSEDTAPRFHSEQHRERLTELIWRFMREIAMIFDVAPKEYEPLLCEREWKGRTLIDGEGWAMGFWEGINLRPAAWAPIWAADAATLMQPVYLLGADELDETEAKLVADPLKCHKLAVEMEANIQDIRRFWASYRTAPAAAVSTSTGIPSGDVPCTCGSSKRFKHCCGAAPVLH